MGSILDCKKVQPRLSEYVDGALDGDTAWSVKLHLASCAVCSRVDAEIRGTANLLQQLPEMTPSADFDSKLAARLADQVLKPRRPSPWDRLRDWWFDVPYARPLVGSAVALAALVPVLVVNYPHPAISPPSAAKPANSSTLEQVWAEHASSDPFGDNSSLLLTAQSPLAESGAADDAQVD